MSTKAKAQKRVIPKPDAPIQQDSEKMSGAPTIGKYRLPVEMLIDYLADNSNLDEFLDAFDGTDRDAVLAVLGVIRQAVNDGLLTGIKLRKEHDYRLMP